MFTGLIEQTGTILSLEKKTGTTRITVEAPGLAARLREGDSIAVSGVCLTALDISDDSFHADLAQETVERTSLTRLAPGSIVNLELPTPAGTPLGGHVVQGHVDTTGSLLSMHPVSENAALRETDWWLTIDVPPSIGRYIVEKGSIALEGISLTVARWDGQRASIAVIPHTYARTNLHALKSGDPVNLEADVLMKFAAQRAESLAHAGPDLTVAYLIENGY
jgi:riboflavin synthase